MTRSKRASGQQWVDAFDRFLLPMAAAMVCVFVAAQAATFIPGVRQTVDRVEGRFVSQQTVAGTASEQVQLTCYLAGQLSSDDAVTVESQGKVLGTLSNKPLSIEVSNGEQIQFERSNAGSNELVVSVEHNSPKLIQPISGWSATLTARRTIVALPPIQFAG